MTTLQTTTSLLNWGIDYRWTERNEKTYFIQVFTSLPHPAEGHFFKSRIAAEEAALQAGLRWEGKI